MSCRKKIDSKIWNEWNEYTQVMESEVRSLRAEVSRTQECLRLATRRCKQLGHELRAASTERERDRLLRDQQLSRILRALLLLESRLKLEQKSIRQLLAEKDSLITSQQLEIDSLRRLAGPKIDLPPNDNHNIPHLHSSDFQEPDSGLNKDIQKLKCEIISKLSEKLDDRVVQQQQQQQQQQHQLQQQASTNIRKTHSFAGSDVSKASSLTSSEHTDASIITTTTDGGGSPSLLSSTEGFCEGESTDVSPGSTLNKSSSRCTPTIVTTGCCDDGELGAACLVAVAASDGKQGSSLISRSDSKDDGMDCNYASDEEERDQPIYQNACCDQVNAPKDCSNNNNNNNVQQKITARLDCPEESPGSCWYSDPDEDRLLNDEMLRHSVYRPAVNSNHNSVLECVNQILLRDMEDEENCILSVPRRFKHRGKIVRFQPARLSDIESVGSEMERRNSDEPHTSVNSSANLANPSELQDDNDNDEELASSVATGSVDCGFEATNSEDEFGMRIVPAIVHQTNGSSLDQSESGLDDEDVDETKARPIVIIEPCVTMDDSNSNKSTRTITKSKSSTPSSPTSLRMERIEEKTCLQMSTKGLTLAKNLDYEDIESLPELIGSVGSSSLPRTPPALPPKPQFHNTLILKKIPSPSFLIDETLRKKQQNNALDSPLASPAPPKGLLLTTPSGASSSIRSLKFEPSPSAKTNKNNNINNNNINNNVVDESVTNMWKNRFNNVRSSFQLMQQQNGCETTTNTQPERNRSAPKITNIIKHFEEFKIEGGNMDELGCGSNEPAKKLKISATPAEYESNGEYDIQQNFEEFNLDECDLSAEEPDSRLEADGSEAVLAASQLQQQQQQQQQQGGIDAAENNNSLQQPAETSAGSNSSSGSNYDSFLEATGLSNKSILTPSRLLSNHKSMLKPKDVKYKSMIKASAVTERHGVSGLLLPGPAQQQQLGSNTHTKHWTGPFV